MIRRWEIALKMSFCISFSLDSSQRHTMSRADLNPLAAIWTSQPWMRLTIPGELSSQLFHILRSTMAIRPLKGFTFKMRNTLLQPMSHQISILYHFPS